jgi:hypothetical protein
MGIARRGLQLPPLREGALWAVMIPLMIWYFPDWWPVLLQDVSLVIRELFGG